MSTPQYYSPDRVGELYSPNLDAATAAGRESGLAPAAEDARRILLLLVDMQVDFIHPDGALSVPGAVDDTRRVVEWIYYHTPRLSAITASLDSHLPIQIFSPTWWQDASGAHPPPFTTITHEAILDGVWSPLYEPLWSRDYARRLEERARKQLMIWPFHCLIGTPGAALVPALSEAIAYHSAARQSQPIMVSKGSIPKTEHYSIMEPEVKVSDHPQGAVNERLLDDIAAYDLIYVAGQARSHCVLETVNSMTRYYPPEVVRKMRILEDGMSSVAHPEIDFEALASEAFARLETNGLRLAKTTDNLG